MASHYVDPHNSTVLITLKIGDLVEFPRKLYSHWGVYIGNQQIVHLTGIGNGGSKDAFHSGSPFSVCGVYFAKACVKIDDFFKVAEGCKAKRNNDKDDKCKPLHPAEIVRRARAKVGEIGYNLIWHNCEHLAAYLRYDVKWSKQIDTATEVFMGAGALATVGLLAYSSFGGSDEEN